MEWTEDMSVRLGRETSARDLVLYLQAADQDGTSRREVLDVLTERFALSFDDARLAMDRVQGGAVRAGSGNPANEPDPVQDPLAWTSFRLVLGLPVEDDAAAAGPSLQEREAAQDILAGARPGERTRGTDSVAVALEVARVAVESQERNRIRFHQLLAAATCLSGATEATIERLRPQLCATEGSQEWVDAVALAAAARQVTAKFAAQPDPDLEERGLGLVGRIVTGLLGQSHAFVGRVMIESARCLQRNGELDRAAQHAESMLADFAVLLDEFADEDPFDEHVIALEYLLAAVDLLTEVRGSSAELDALRTRTQEVLSRASED